MRPTSVPQVRARRRSGRTESASQEPSGRAAWTRTADSQIEQFARPCSKGQRLVAVFATRLPHYDNRCKPQPDSIEGDETFLIRCSTSHREYSGVTGNEDVGQKGQPASAGCAADPNRPTTMIEDDVGVW